MPAGVLARHSTAVPALQPASTVVAPPEQRTSLGLPPRQPSLFPGDRPKIIPFDSIGPGRPPREQLARARRPRQPAAPSGAGARTGQQSLDLRPRDPRPQTVYDEAPIASTRVRLRAAFLDAALCAVGVGFAAAVFHLFGGAFALGRKTAVFYAGAVTAMLLAYHLFWCLLGRETAGMRCFRLRLLTFDGSPPGWRLRLFRFAATCLGLSAVGLGLVWALVDEEGLTWHDHMSKTFPTVHDPNPGTFHRK
ncbi:MAG: RDD family protein [Bryobacteraceae bacterium]